MKNKYKIASDTEWIWYCIWHTSPVSLTDKSTKAEKADFERWTRANKVALTIMKNAMTDTMRGGIKKFDMASDYLKAMECKFKESQKGEIGQHMTLLTTYKFEEWGQLEIISWRWLRLSRSLILWMSNWWESVGFYDPASTTSEVQPIEDLLQHWRQNLDSWWTYCLVCTRRK